MLLPAYTYDFADVQFRLLLPYDIFPSLRGHMRLVSRPMSRGSEPLHRVAWRVIYTEVEHDAGWKPDRLLLLFIFILRL